MSTGNGDRFQIIQKKKNKKCTAITPSTGEVRATANNNAMSFGKPVPLGVSCSNSSDFKRAGICSAGTLGFVVQDPDGNNYVVSCAHVWVNVDPSFGFGVQSTQVGDIIAQPGDLDAGCNPANIKNSIATLYKWTTMNPLTKSTEVDLAVAQIIPNKVTPFGTQVNIGQPIATDTHGSPIPKIGQVVQKSGRTTGLTYGRVEYIYADFDVEYETPKGELFTLSFRDLMVITSNKFSAAGDSGALILGMDKRPSGLLFAGNERFTLAYSIRNVMRRLDKLMGTQMTIVGTESPMFPHLSPFPEFNKAFSAKQTLKQLLGKLKEFVGVGIGRDDINRIILAVFVKSNNKAIKDIIPTEVDGYKVIVEFIKNVPKAF